MSLSVRDLLYEERLQRLNLPTLQKRREREEVIAVYRASKEMEKMYRDRYIHMVLKEYKRSWNKLKRTTCKKDT